MNSSTSKGDDLENKIYNYLRLEIEEERFPVRSSCCRIYRKKGYHSKDRGGDIVFDVSIEVTYPDERDYSLVFLIECKNYGAPIKVDDLEEFHSKVEQVASANSKAILISTNSFQRGARNYAKSKGIGIARFTDPHDLKWELMRSPSTTAISTSESIPLEAESSLASESNEWNLFDFVFESSIRLTNTLWHFFEDLFEEVGFEADKLFDISNDRSRLDPIVPYISHEQIEKYAESVIAKICHVDSEINLEDIAASIPGLRINLSPTTIGATLGIASFESNQITLFADSDQSRRRFTLSHEISHFLLDHGRYMRRDTCSEEDLASLRSNSNLPREVRRMEYQANLLASCLLMPRRSFMRTFVEIARELDLHDRGFGYIYFDSQICNLRDFMLVTSRLMKNYGVSRTAVRIRLQALGLLTDAKAQEAQATRVLEQIM